MISELEYAEAKAIVDEAEKEKLMELADKFVRAKLSREVEKNHIYILENPQRYKDLFDGFMAGAKQQK